jgi:flagella basal body P-ring formation protein FlgA
VNVPVAKTNISKGEYIDMSKITYIELDHEDVPKEIYTEIHLIIGKNAKTDIRSNDFFNEDNIE